MKQKPFKILYWLNIALLFTHLGMGGGIQRFLAINFFLLIISLIGFRHFLCGSYGGTAFSLLIAVSGIFVFLIHGYFILAGRHEFTLPASEFLLSLISIVSLAQGFVAVKMVRR